VIVDDPMQQAGSQHFVLAKLGRHVSKGGITIGLRYGFGSLHQPVVRERAAATLRAARKSATCDAVVGKAGRTSAVRSSTPILPLSA